MMAIVLYENRNIWSAIDSTDCKILKWLTKFIPMMMMMVMIMTTMVVTFNLDWCSSGELFGTYLVSSVCIKAV